MSIKKVLVTGCFDMLHSGHVAFLREASQFGLLHLCIGSDETVFQLKGRYPVINQNERKFILEAIKYVHEVRINSGSGIMDFLNEFDDINPDIFVVNEDGHTSKKEELCVQKNVEYKILHRIPHEDLPVRSTTALRTNCTIPFRIDLAGGWLDQPFVSKLFPGSVLTISIEPTVEFNNRSGMSSSTRNKAIELWRTEIPAGDKEKLAKILFSYENPPGTKEVAGSQDSIGIIFPGLNKSFYEGTYWPAKIESIHDEHILQFIENNLQLLTLGPRINSYSVIDNTNITTAGAQALAQAADDCWNAILDCNITDFGTAFRESFEAQIAMFPNMVDDEILNTIQKYKDVAYGWKLSGAGGGGYLILISDKKIDGAFGIKIRRR